MKPQSQNARILAVLSDGQPHTTAEIHQRAGFSRLNSRIAELRAQGYRIPPCERTGEGTGPETFVYRLLSEREESPQNSPPPSGRGSLLGGDSGGTRPTGVAASRSESSPTAIDVSTPGSPVRESDDFRSTGPFQAVPRASINTEPTQLALEVAS